LEEILTSFAVSKAPKSSATSSTCVASNARSCISVSGIPLRTRLRVACIISLFRSPRTYNCFLEGYFSFAFLLYQLSALGLGSVSDDREFLYLASERPVNEHRFMTRDFKTHSISAARSLLNSMLPCQGGSGPVVSVLLSAEAHESRN
jgi:hypothetical protein